MGLIRLLLFIVVGYLAYLLLRSILRKSSAGTAGTRHRAEHVDNARLEEDPVCGVCISRETAVRRRIDDKEFFFCSEQCADKYQTNSRK